MPGVSYETVKLRILSEVPSVVVQMGQSKLLVANNMLPPSHSLANQAEQLLPPFFLNALPQLRSGFCSHLSSYRHSVGRVNSPTCPECKATEQNADYLSRCPGHQRVWPKQISRRYPSTLPRHWWNFPPVAGKCKETALVAGSIRRRFNAIVSQLWFWLFWVIYSRRLHIWCQFIW